ncbi:MAG: DUF4115 domain-containing protein [Candidatus Omnitrophica bacterium]|nr:DUF4115 domain-containing protein [Candidatus Omnitrophota bacterium]MBU1869968.1 DUF4115 domain-containing protein [Candidatus Omnitrophota bacterium]
MESAGSRLKKIRMEKGLTLEEVQKRTKLHMNILQAIEGDSLTGINPVYLKGFVKIYCKVLGVDEKDYLAGYKEPQPQFKSANAQPVFRQEKPKETVPAGTPFLRDAPLKVGSIASKKVFNPIFIIVIAIVAVAGLFFLGRFIFARKQSAGAKKPSAILKMKEPRSVKTQAKSKPAAVPAFKPAQPKVKTASKKPTVTLPNTASGSVGQSIPLDKKESVSGINLGILAKDKCWVSLKADGRLVFQRMLEKGRYESWNAKERIELSLGDAGAVELQVNDQIFSYLGRKGQPLKNVTITKDGLNIGR